MIVIYESMRGDISIKISCVAIVSRKRIEEKEHN